MLMIPNVKRLAFSLSLTLGLGCAFVPLGCGSSGGGTLAVPFQGDAKVPESIALRIRTCAAEHREHLRGDKHSVSFDVKLANDGEVDSVALRDSTLPDEDLEACMAGALGSLSMDTLPSRYSGSRPRDPGPPESRMLLGQTQVMACFASPPCVLALAFLIGATYITVQVYVHATSTTKPKPRPAPIATAAPTATSTDIPIPITKWSNDPGCDLQYEQDTVYCNRFSKKQDAAKCRENRSERLAYCIKSKGQTGHPPRYRSQP